MEPWAPQRPPRPWGRPTALSLDPNRDLWREGYRRPVPHPWHNGERFRQRQDIRGSPQPQQDPRADHQQPHYVSRPGDRRPPASSVDYYQGGYPSQLYSRYGFSPQTGPNSAKCLWTDCSFPSSFSFYSSSFFLFPSSPCYIDLAKPFPLPNWILVMKNIFWSRLVCPAFHWFLSLPQSSILEWLARFAIF